MFNLPKECIVDKIIPKKIFYDNVNMTNTIKQEFINKVEKIIWKHKIYEENINVAKTQNVEEIEIFELDLKEKYEVKNLIKVITKEIPYPILFLIKFNEEFQYAIKYEDSIYFSEWNNNITFNFVDFDLEKVYENIVKAITNIKNNIKNIQEELDKQQEKIKIQNEINKLENQIKKEQQFNRKVEINKRILELKNKMEMLNAK